MWLVSHWLFYSLETLRIAQLLDFSYPGGDRQFAAPRLNKSRQSATRHRFNVHLLDFISIESKVYTLLGQENVNACGRNEREAKCGQGKITGVCAGDLNECLDSIVSLVQIAQIERVAP